MYTNNEVEQKKHKSHAWQTITRVAEQYVSMERRLQELEWHRGLYQAYGWQSAIDVLDEQMVAWGRSEQMSNAELWKQYDEELKKRVVPDKGEWDEEDLRLCGEAWAYSEARYAVRFLPLIEAREYLSKRRQSILDGIDDPHCAPADALKGRTAGALLDTIINHLIGLAKGEPHETSYTNDAAHNTP
jgi:hypothetical protein